MAGKAISILHKKEIITQFFLLCFSTTSFVKLIMYDLTSIKAAAIVKCNYILKTIIEKSFNEKFLNLVGALERKTKKLWTNYYQNH